MGVCLGVNFRSIKKVPGPDLLNLLQNHDPQTIPEDVRDECLNSMRPEERPMKGDWFAIWGGTSRIQHMFRKE